MTTAEWEYSGEWKDDRPDGRGTLTWKDKTEYIGGWKDGKMHGECTVTVFENGKCIGCFTGIYREGKADGYGTMVWNDDNIKYVGEWMGGKRHGSGMMEKGMEKASGQMQTAQLNPVFGIEICL